ncbi:MAG: hypothetical protein KDH96_03180, partial [Candidatus Riesia sp.]|nr:hypothetical protein [Candidatus Riesia sp.]
AENIYEHMLILCRIPTPSILPKWIHPLPNHNLRFYRPNLQNVSLTMTHYDPGIYPVFPMCVCDHDVRGNGVKLVLDDLIQ